MYQIYFISDVEF